MKKFFHGVQLGLGFIFVLSIFLGGIYLTKAWQGDSSGASIDSSGNNYAADGDVLTVDKWNALVNRVNVDIPNQCTRIDKMQICWGYIEKSFNAARSSLTVTFPKPFKAGQNPVVTATTKHNRWNVSAESITNTGFLAYVHHITHQSSSTVQRVNWMAVGEWE